VKAVSFHPQSLCCYAIAAHHDPIEGKSVGKHYLIVRFLRGARRLNWPPSRTYSHVILRPWLGYVPKDPTTPFRDQMVNLQALPLEEADPALELLCPVCVLHAYVDRTECFRNSDRQAICLLWWEAEGKGSLQATAVSLESGHHRFGIPAARSNVPPWRDCPLHPECGVLLGSSTWCRIFTIKYIILKDM